MRDIEYRGIRQDNGEWLFGYYWYDNRKGQENHYIRHIDSLCECAVFSESVGRYTGLKDKNGVKIFEKDIVFSAMTGRTGDVQFSHGVFGIEWFSDKETKNMLGGWKQLHNLRRMDDGYNEKIEVIGDMIQNGALK